MKSLACLFSFLFLAFSTGFAAEPASAPATGKTIRLFTVGNSFSQNATRNLGALAKANGDTLILGTAVVGGASFEVHWKKAQAAEKDAADKQGQYTKGKNLKQWLQSDQWDCVTIQQASIKSHDVATYRPFAQQLSDYIKQHAPKATILMHQTWEYRSDDPRFSAKNPKPGEPKTQDEMYAGLTSAYSTVAKELGFRLIPVGDAFHLANRDPQWGFKGISTPFDPKTAKPGELPEQKYSLNVGWNWKKGTSGKTTLNMDGHHANTAGEYLGACVWYEVFFGKSSVDNSYVAPGLDPAYARFLQETAHRAVEASAK